MRSIFGAKYWCMHGDITETSFYHTCKLKKSICILHNYSINMRLISIATQFLLNFIRHTKIELLNCASKISQSRPLKFGHSNFPLKINCMVACLDQDRACSFFNSPFLAFFPSFTLSFFPLPCILSFFPSFSPLPCVLSFFHSFFFPPSDGSLKLSPVTNKKTDLRMNELVHSGKTIKWSTSTTRRDTVQT